MGSPQYSGISSASSSPNTPAALDHLRILKKRYRISEKQILGEGAFAKVHMGLDTKTNTNVAVKTYLRSDEKAFAHFRRTINVWRTIADHAEKSINGMAYGEQEVMVDKQQSLDETYILDELKESLQLDEALPFAEFIACLDVRMCFVQLLDYSTDEDGEPGIDPESDSLWIVQEMGAGSLDEEIDSRAERQQPMQGEQLTELLWSLVCITWGLHVCGFVHMDIKPMNIVKFTVATEDPDGAGSGDEACSPRLRSSKVQWKLIDLDGALEAHEKVCVKSEKLVFTPIFMPPELAEAIVAKQDFVTASRLMDVWSIGMCMMQAIFEVPVLEPFYCQWKEETGSDEKFLRWLADFNGEPIIHGDMEQHIRKIDRGLCMVLKHMLERDASKRYCTARCLMHTAFRKKRKSLTQKDDAIQAWMSEAKSVQNRKPSDIFTTDVKGGTSRKPRSSACVVM